MTINENEMDLKNAESSVIAEEAAKLLLSKSGSNLKMFSVADYTSVTDYYVNVTAKSTTHVCALADELADSLEARGAKPLGVEGRSGKNWILVDFGSVIVNVFDSATREFYNLDKFLPAESQMDISSIISEVDKKYE